MASSTWAIISLIGLIVIVIIANVKNINVGLVGFAMAMLIGTISGLELKDVYNSFNTQIFLRMLSMQALIVIARDNGTMQIIGNAAMKLTKGNRIRALPIILYLVMGIGSFFSLGISSVMTPLIWLLSYQMGFEDPLKLGFCTLFTLFAWGVSPYSMQGLNLITYAQESGYTLNVMNAAILEIITGTVLFIALYIRYGWYKQEPIEVKLDDSVNTTFGKNQIFTLCAFAAFVIGNVGFGLDLMIIPIIASIILMCLGAANPKKVIRDIPWPVLFMIGGMTTYVSVIKNLGGVDLLVSIFVAAANKFIAPGLMAGICAFMSLFASGNGVVIPTMTSTIPVLANHIEGLNIGAMYVAVMIGANATCVSPMSTIGAQGLAYYAAAANPTEEQSKKVFNSLFKYAAIFMVWSVIAGLIGLYGLLPVS